MLKTHRIIAVQLLSAVLATALLPGLSNASDPDVVRIPVMLGDYHFSPHELTVTAGRPVLFELTNTDSITPHNFTLRSREGGLDIDINVPAGGNREVTLTPEVPGSYTFYCNKKLPFIKSHRDRGMEGTLVVTP